MSDLYLALDANDEPAVWADNPERPGYPFCVARKRDIDPLLWTVVTERIPKRDEPQDEPTDPAVRVRDNDGLMWALFDKWWMSEQGDGPLSWADLVVDYSPLEVIQPDAPSADERPFQVGDRVRVADDARWVSGVVRGQTVRITSVHEHPDWPSVTVALASGTPQLVHPDDLTHADAPC